MWTLSSQTDVWSPDNFPQHVDLQINNILLTSLAQSGKKNLYVFNSHIASGEIKYKNLDKKGSKKSWMIVLWSPAEPTSITC